jgi:class 3 adenylate cyclase
MAVAVGAPDGITFAMELQRHAITACAPLSLRIGIATGDTMLFEGQDYIGNAPNLAARLCDAAVDIGTLIPADQATKLPVGVYSVPHNPVNLPGFSQPIEVVSLAGEPLIDGRYDINDFWTRSPFVG